MSMSAHSSQVRDPLTGLPSCHAFLLELQNAIVDTPRPQALIVIEPRIRNAATLAQRATRLATIGRVLTLASGRGAQVTRLDTRRFAILLPQCDLQSAADVADRLCESLDVFFNRDAVNVTACAGIASTPEHFDGAAEPLIDLALWRCEAARFGGASVCGNGSPPGELQRWPALAAASLEWNAV